MEGGEFKEIEVSTLGELLDQSTPAPDPASGRRRNYSVYRGARDGPFGLLTSLDQLGGCNPPHTKRQLEEHIFRNFLRYARPFLKQPQINEWELLVTAQHHGVPTRLLDWTYSPVVAAHFATLDTDEKADRVIWKLNWREMHQHFGLKPLAFLVGDLDELIRSRGFDSIWDFFNREKEGEGRFVCMLEPPALDDRILAQTAAFTLASTKGSGFEQLLRKEGLNHCLTRFVIPAARIEYLRDQLDLCSLDERRLFPGLDGVAAEIKRYYGAGGTGD
jgi:hypothetical protein